MNRAPVVSVVMPAYNHAPFVVEAIRSVLDQDFGDFELLVGDDGSKDGTADAARSVHDPRLTVFDHRVNGGAAAMHNTLLERATGKYVAVINSDDAWMPGKLSAQVAFLEENPNVAACFGRVRFIGRDGKPIPKNALEFGDVFDVENRSRGAWLRHFFTKGNCICHPTLLIRRKAYLELGPYDNRLRLLPDFDMWIRLAKRCSLSILDQEMIRFRILPGENASANTSANRIRCMNEHHFIVRDFFSGVSRDMLQEGFSDLLVKPYIPSELHIDIEKALLFFTPAAHHRIHKLIGLMQVHELLASPRHREVMAADYKLDECAFYGLTSEVDTFVLQPPRLRQIHAHHLPREFGRALRAWAKRAVPAFWACGR